MQTYGGAYAATQGDPAFRAADGVALLTQQLVQQANILAFNDVFRVIGIIAVAQFFYAALLFVLLAVRMKRQGAQPPSPPTSPKPASEPA